ncbi:peptidyl-prolyl cis-trans isomerase G-like [Anneissia japonica]|uniref:peptidyl-prolyl cis-trans isomerase G-like n=1 Tax=Anneissia japonica TaxID=1529436 RepID=UPI0014258DAC|nr:peptidyl-prolyl cis-trans isomerase G-like [Anneissia japonica]
MASDLEDDEDLASLRSAALASLNVRSNQSSPSVDTNHQENNNQDDEEEDEDENLEALRLAALKTKKAVVPQPVTPQPRGPSPVPLSEAPINAVRGNNLISIPLVDFSSQDTSSNGPVVPEVKKEVRNDKFSRFQSDTESEEEEDVESEPEYNRPESSADEADGSDISDDESVNQSGKSEESDDSSGENDGSASSSESESETEKSSETESSTSSSESDEDSSSEGRQLEEESTEEIIEKKNISEAKNGTIKLQTENIKLKSIDPPSIVSKTGLMDLRNQLRKKHSERSDRVEHKERLKRDHVTDHISSRSHSRYSYGQQNRISRRVPDKYQGNRDRKGNNVDEGNKHRHNYDRPPRKSEEVRKKDNYSSDNKREKDSRSTLSSTERSKILDRRKSDKQKEKSQTKKPYNDSLKKNEKLLKGKSLPTEHLSLSDSESDIDTDSRFKQAKIDRAGDQIESAPSRIVTSMQFNKNIEPNFGRKRDFHRDHRKDQDLRYGPRFDRKLESRRTESYRNDQYHKKDEKSYQKKHDMRESYASSRHKRSHGRDPMRSRELEFVDDSDEDMNKKGIRSFVHTNNTKNNRKENGPIVKRYKDSEQRRKDSKKEGKKPSSKERIESSRSKENRTGKKKAESSVKFLKKVKHLDVGDTSKTTEVSVTFDSDPEKVLKKSKKSIQERLGKTVSKAPVKLRLGPKDNLKSEIWHGLEKNSKGSESSAQDARKFVSKDAGKSRKSVKERLNLKRTPKDIDLDSTVEPSRKIVRSSAVEKLSDEEKLKRKKREREIQEKIRKIEERNLASSKEHAKYSDIDLPSESNNKDKALELRIRRIKEKNEAILKRQREIEEDKQKYGK